MTKKIGLGDDIGFYADWSKNENIEVLQAARAGIPNAIKEGKKRGILDRDGNLKLDNE